MKKYSYPLLLIFFVTFLLCACVNKVPENEVYDITLALEKDSYSYGTKEISYTIINNAQRPISEVSIPVVEEYVDGEWKEITLNNRYIAVGRTIYPETEEDFTFLISDKDTILEKGRYRLYIKSFAISGRPYDSVSLSGEFDIV